MRKTELPSCKQAAVTGDHDAALDRSSDGLCTALQLTNFWQDLGRDWQAGRLYVPRDVQAAHGASESDLSAGRLTSAWAQSLAECVSFTRDRFREGRPVCDGVAGRLRFELRLTWLGGQEILKRVEGRKTSLLDYRPALEARDVPRLFWRAVRWF